MEVAASVYKQVIFPCGSSGSGTRLTETQKAILDATTDCIKVLSVDGILLTMNRTGCTVLNVPCHSDFGMPWLPLLPASMQDAGHQAFRNAVSGRGGRFHARSVTDGGVAFWDTLLTPIVDTSGRVASILSVSRDVTTKARLEIDLAEAIKRERLLSREMQHRIKNLFSVVSALISISEREAQSDSAPHTAMDILREKVAALHLASEAAFSMPVNRGGNPEEVPVAMLVSSVLRPYGNRCHANGSHAAVSAGNFTAVALILHEFATNAVKYGALSVESGEVTINWEARDDQLRIVWVETGGPSVVNGPRRQGFGTRMVERMVQCAGGQINKSWSSGGLMAEISLPNRHSNGSH